MAEQFVAIAPDGSGKKVQTVENTVNGQVVQAQVVVPADSVGVPYATFPSVITDAFLQLKDAINRLARPLFLDLTTGRAKVQVDAFNATLGTVTTVTTVTTVATVTNMNQLAGQDAKNAFLNVNERTAYFTGPRSRITG